MPYTPELNGRWTMTDLLNLELAKARQRVQRAELVLQHAKEMLEEGCGVGVNIALVSRIRTAQRRVVEARAQLRRIDLAKPGRVRRG